MKLKIDWKKLGKQLWEMCRALARVGREATAKPPARAHAVKPVLLAAVGGGIMSVAAGCSGLAQAPRGQTTEVVAFGVPAIAWVSHTSQSAEHHGGDTNAVSQVNPVTTVVPISAK